MSKNADIFFGCSCESVLHEDIKNRFGADIVQSTNRFTPFDFSNDSVFIEVKSRRNTKNRYPDTMVGYNKIRFFLDHPDKTSYCVFNFTDGAYYVEVNKDTIKQFNYKYGGRTDRGKNEIKQYCFIPVKLLRPLVEVNNEVSHR